MYVKHTRTHARIEIKTRLNCLVVVLVDGWPLNCGQRAKACKEESRDGIRKQKESAESCTILPCAVLSNPSQGTNVASMLLHYGEQRAACSV